MAATLSYQRDSSSPAEAMLGITRHNESLSLDANSALIELEKGLRSGKVGEQCEAIVRFPALIEKYPFPILVNSAFLKLAEVFRGGTNFMKVCVLKVIQRSCKHLDKVLNVDEFSKRIYSVIHSNDPVARAITLRVFGYTSTIIGEKKNIHHSIRSSLDSHDEVEVEAAIFATKQFCKQSWSFAEGICNKVMDMIEGLSTPIEMKLKLIPIFQFMDKDLAIVNKIREKCSELLGTYPSMAFVSTTLHTLSCLSQASLLNIPSQISLLLSYIESDPRGRVKIVALQDLRRLAKCASHLWKYDNIVALVKFATQTPSVKLQQLALVGLCDLTALLTDNQFWSEELLRDVEDLSNVMNVESASLALLVISNVLTHSMKDQGAVYSPEVYERVQLNIQMLISISIAEEHVTPFQRCLSCAARVLQLCESTRVNLVDFLCSLIPVLSGFFLKEACRCLAKSNALYHREFQQHLPMLTLKVKRSVQESRDKAEQDSLVAVITLLFQVGFNSPEATKVQLQRDLLEVLRSGQWDGNHWTLYRIVRLASRLGYPVVGSKLCHQLTGKVASENMFYWLESLCKFQEAEAKIFSLGHSSAQVLDTLLEANCLYHDGLVSIKAAVTHDNPFSFHCAYVLIRANLLQAYVQLLTCCASIKTSPPPAIAMGISLATGQEVHKLSRLAPQFQECIERFTAVSDQCSRLLRSSFNADPKSLKHIETLQESCQTISYAVHILVINRQETRTVSSPSSNTPNVDVYGPLERVSAINNLLLKTAEELANECRDTSLSNEQGQFICQAVVSQLQIPCLFPLYFFKSLQNTSIQLSASPINKSPNEPVLVTLENQFVLKVEGVISSNTSEGRALFRAVAAVCLDVRVQVTGGVKLLPISNVKMPETDISLRQTVNAQSDYFSSEFLIDFTCPQLHTIAVTASVLDLAGSTWDTGPSLEIKVDVTEHGSIKRNARLN